MKMNECMHERGKFEVQLSTKSNMLTWKIFDFIFHFVTVLKITAIIKVIIKVIIILVIITPS